MTPDRNDDVMTATLHIEHDITDYPTWKAAFDGFADARNQAGVTEHRVRLDDDDNHHIVIDLDFDSVSPARAFAASCTTTSGGPPPRLRSSVRRRHAF